MTSYFNTFLSPNSTHIGVGFGMPAAWVSRSMSAAFAGRDIDVLATRGAG
jgi:hypothetical protein